MSFAEELKQRIMKLDFVHGLYLVPVGLIGFWTMYYAFQYTLHVMAGLMYTVAIIEGLHRMCYNPVKQEAIKVIRREQYIVDNLTPTNSTPAPNPPINVGDA